MERMKQFARYLEVRRAHVAAGSHTEKVSPGNAAQGAPAQHQSGYRPAGRLAVLSAFFVTIAGLSGIVERADAHEIPTDVVIQAYLAPGDDEVTLVLRAPLEAMRDVTFPQRGPGYINISEAEPYLRDAAEIWLINFFTIYADGVALEEWEIDAVRLALPSDRSFAEFETALASIRGAPLSDDTELYSNQALLDVIVRYPIAGGAGEYAVKPEFGRLGLRSTTVMNFLPEEGVRRVFEFSGSPGLVPLDPRWHQAFIRFVQLGVEHIVIGVDHILFVLCLIIPFRRIRPLILIVTSFTVAHSITLALSTSRSV